MGGSEFCDLCNGNSAYSGQQTETPNTYCGRGVDAHEFHLRVFPRLCEFGAYIPRFEIVLFEQSGQNRAHTVERERRGTREALR